MDRIELFRIFSRVVECSSFTRAADTMGIPRSTVSAAVLELEKRLGTKLLHRTTRKVAPTNDGAVFYERCLSLIADIEEAETLFRQSAPLLSGRLRIDVPGRIGRLIIAPALPEFLERYPQIEIELGVSDRNVDVIGEGVDCALRVGELKDSGLIAYPIGALAIINVASPTYIAAHGAPKKPDDLAAHFAVNYASPSNGRIHEWEWVERGSPRFAPIRSRVTVNSAEAYIACCLAGLGLIQIPAYDVRHHIETGVLVEVMPQYRAAPVPMNLLYPQRPHHSRRLQAFVEWLAPLLQSKTMSNSAKGAKSTLRESAPGSFAAQ